MTAPRKTRAKIRPLCIVDSQFIFSEIDHELHRAGRQDPLVYVLRLIIFVEPKIIDEIGEQFGRFIAAKAHYLFSVGKENATTDEQQRLSICPRSSVVSFSLLFGDGHYALASEAPPLNAGAKMSFANSSSVVGVVVDSLRSALPCTRPSLMAASISRYASATLSENPA